MRKSLAIAAAGCLLVAPGVAFAQACGARVMTGETRFFIEPAAAAARDTVIVARVCLAVSARGLGSYMATITFDSTQMRVMRVDVSGGMQVANSRTPGTIRLAGASPGGFSSGPLASVIFKPSGSRTLSRITLAVSEASTPAGASLMDETRVQGWPANANAGQSHRPTVDSVSPRSAEVTDERVTDLVLHGRGFAPAGNIVLFDGVEVTGLLSEKHSTVVRFAAPCGAPWNGGASWENLTFDLPDVPVLAVVLEPGSRDPTIGTDLGVFTFRSGSSSWVPVLNGLPNVAVYDLVFDAPRSRMIAATHGRGMFSLDVTVTGLRGDVAGPGNTAPDGVVGALES